MAVSMHGDGTCLSSGGNTDVRHPVDADAIARRSLPGKIANALVTIYEGLQSCDLTHTQRRVLACLVRYGVKQGLPRDYIFLKKSSIAQRTGLNEATVYRSLNALEEAGLIEREPQRISLVNLRTIGRIRLTECALQALAITNEPLTGGGTAVAPDLAPVQDVNVNPQSSSKKHPGEPEAFVRRDGRAVPADLVWLSDQQGLQVSGIFLLMRLAREAKQRLSDIVTVAARALRELRGRELFAYLQALIRKPTDYSHVAKRQREEAETKRIVEVQRRAQTDRVAVLVGCYRGQRVTRVDGAVFEVDSVSVTLTTAAGQRYAASHAQALPWLEEFATIASGKRNAAPLVMPPVSPLARTPRHPGKTSEHLQRLKNLVGARRSPSW